MIVRAVDAHNLLVLSHGQAHEHLPISDILARPRRGHVVDLSHLAGDAPAFYEILEHAVCAPIASHRSSRAINRSERALSDTAIQAIADAEGVIGVHAGAG